MTARRRALVVAVMLAATTAPGGLPWTRSALGLTLLPLPDTLTMVHDRTAVVAPPGVLGNDVGLLGGSTAVLDSGPSHGVLDLRPDGGYTYTPNPGYVGTDVFRYHPTGLLSTSTTDTITITNAAPVATNDVYSATTGVELTVPAPGVLDNDHDPDGDALSATLVSGGGNGSLDLAENGGFTYKSGGSFTGTRTFTYRVSDGLASSGTATVRIVVSAEPTPSPSPTPTPTLPLPTLPLPTLPLPSLPLPTLPLPTIRPTLRPSLPPTLPPLPTPPLGQPTPSPSGAPDASRSPIAAGPVASPGSSGAPGAGAPRDPFTVGSKTGTPLDGLVNVELPTIGGLEWAVPGLVLTVPGLLLVLAIAIQAVVSAVWLPFVRRWLGFGLRRGRREARATR